MMDGTHCKILPGPECVGPVSFKCSDFCVYDCTAIVPSKDIASAYRGLMLHTCSAEQTGCRMYLPFPKRVGNLAHCSAWRQSDIRVPDGTLDARVVAAEQSRTLTASKDLHMYCGCCECPKCLTRTSYARIAPPTLRPASMPEVSMVRPAQSDHRSDYDRPI